MSAIFAILAATAPVTGTSVDCEISQERKTAFSHTLKYLRNHLDTQIKDTGCTHHNMLKMIIEFVSLTLRSLINVQFTLIYFRKISSLYALIKDL